MKRIVLILLVALLKIITVFIPFCFGYYIGIDKVTLPMALAAGILFLYMLKVVS